LTGCRKGTKFGTLIVLALLYITAETGTLWPRRSPCGAIILRGLKKIRKAFLVYIV